jgi:hypothetical protein
MNIVDSVGRLFGGDGDIAKEPDPIFLLREWVCWDLFQVVPACEVLQGCGRSVLMKRAIVAGTVLDRSRESGGPGGVGPRSAP